MDLLLIHALKGKLLLYNGRLMENFKVFLWQNDPDWCIKEMVGLRQGERETRWAQTFRDQGFVQSLRISANEHGRFFLLEKIPISGGVAAVRTARGSHGC